MGVSPGRRSEHFHHGLQYAVTVPEDVAVPEPEDAPTLCAEPRIPAIMIAGAGMLAAIDLDNQLRLDTGEIDDVGRDRELAPEPPAELVLPKLAPQHALSVSQVAPQLSRPVCHWGAPAHIDPARMHYPHPNPPPLAGEGMASSGSQPIAQSLAAGKFPSGI